MIDIRFSNDRNGVTTFRCSNPLHGEIDLKIEPQGDLTQGEVGSYRLQFFGHQQDFPTNFKADCTARFLAGLWCQAPGRNRDLETQEAWAAALKVSETIPNWGIDLPR